MEHSPLLPKDELDIKTLIQFGINKPEDFLIDFYKSVYNIEKKVRIRGLSNYEYDNISIEMYSEITDPATINYVLDVGNEKKNEEALEGELEEEKEPEYNVIQYLQALRLRNVLIVYYAMKDFYPGLTVDYVKQIEGLNQIAKRVQQKSGRTPEVMEKIKFFRKQQKELDAKDSD